MISIAISIGADQAVGSEHQPTASIEAESLPEVANPFPGQTVISLFTPGIYAIDEGEISSQLAEASINGSAFSEAAMGQVLEAVDQVTVREIVTATGGQVAFFLAPSVVVAAKTPIASVAIVQPSIDFGDVLGLDVSAIANVLEPGDPPLAMEDVVLSWQVNGVTASIGDVLSFGDVVQARAFWDHPTGSGSAISAALTVPFAEAAELTIALAQPGYSAGKVLSEADLVWSIEASGYPALQGDDVIASLEVNGVTAVLPYTAQDGDVLVPVVSASHSAGPISVRGQSLMVSTRFDVLGQVDDTIEVDGATGNLTVSVTAPTAIAGVFTLDISGAPLNIAQLQNGPQCFSAPAVAGDADPDLGETIIGQRGLWLYDLDLSAPGQSSFWQRSETGLAGWSNIPGATGDDYVIQSADLGKFLRRQDILTQPGTGSRAAASNVISVQATTAPTVSLNPASTTLFAGTTGTVASLTYGGGVADTVTLTGPDAAFFALSNGNASLDLAGALALGSYSVTVEVANAGGINSDTFTLTVEGALPTYTVSLGALTAGQTFGEPGSGADVEAVLGGAAGNPDDPLAWECSVNNGSTYEALIEPVTALEGQDVIIRISDIDHPSGAFTAISNAVTVSSVATRYAGALLSAAQEGFSDTSVFAVTPTPDPAITVTNGLLTVDGGQSASKNLWQTGSGQVAADVGDLYSIIADFGPIAGGTVLLNTNLSGVNGSLAALTGGEFIRQSVFEVTAPVSQVSGGIRALNGRSFTSSSIATFRLNDLLDLPQAIFLSIGQSNWIGNSAGYDKADIEYADGCLYTPSIVNRSIGADDYPSAAGEMLPMMAMEPMQHQTLNLGQGPGAEFCREIREGIPASQAVHYFAGARAAAGFKDGDLWAGSLDGGGQPTGGSSYVKWWTEARKLFARAQAWHPESYIAGVIVCGGESDLGGTWDEGRNATESLSNLSKLIDDIRTEWGANIPVVISEIGYQPTDTGVAEFIEAQQQLATGSGNATYEKNLCAYVARPSNFVLTDGTHYDAATNRQRGQDAAAAMAALIAQPAALPGEVPVLAPLITESPVAAGEDEFTYTTDLIASTQSIVTIDSVQISDVSVPPLAAGQAYIQTPMRFTRTGDQPGDTVTLQRPDMHHDIASFSEAWEWLLGGSSTGNTSASHVYGDTASELTVRYRAFDGSTQVLEQVYTPEQVSITPVPPVLTNSAASMVLGTTQNFTAYQDETPGEAVDEGFSLDDLVVTSGEGTLVEFDANGVFRFTAPSTTDTTVLTATISNETGGQATKTFTINAVVITQLDVGLNQAEDWVRNEHAFVQENWVPAIGTAAIENNPSAPAGIISGEWAGATGDYNVTLRGRSDVDGENSQWQLRVAGVIQQSWSVKTVTNQFEDYATGSPVTLFNGDLIEILIDAKPANDGGLAWCGVDRVTFAASTGEAFEDFGVFVQSEMANGVGSAGVELPSDPISGNYILAFCAATETDLGSLSFADGWTSIASRQDADGQNLGIAAAYKKSNGTETGSLNPIDWSGSSDESYIISEIQGSGSDLSLVGSATLEGDNPSNGQSSVTLNFDTGDTERAVVYAHFAYLFQNAGTDFDDSAALAAGWTRHEGTLGGSTGGVAATWTYSKQLLNGGADSITLTITAGSNTNRQLSGLGYIIRGVAT
ncbi:MAG: sialate O-acetylesterase [Pseudomonadota bacterium]